MTRTAASLVRDFFLAPEGAAPREAAPASVPPVLAVLGDPRVAMPLACASALVLARSAHHSHAAVCMRPAGSVSAVRLLASGTARREAARLAARGCETDASGRLVRARLPDPPAEAAAAVRRLAAAAGCPLAVALGGPRAPELDAVLTLADAIVLVRRRGDPPGLARLAAAGLARLQIPVAICDDCLGATARLLVTAGVAVPSPARAALAPVVAAVS